MNDDYSETTANTPKDREIAELKLRLLRANEALLNERKLSDERAEKIRDLVKPFGISAFAPLDAVKTLANWVTLQTRMLKDKSNEIARQRNVIDAQDKSLLHWRRSYDDAYVKLRTACEFETLQELAKSVLQRTEELNVIIQQQRYHIGTLSNTLDKVEAGRRNDREKLKAHIDRQDKSIKAAKAKRDIKIEKLLTVIERLGNRVNELLLRLRITKPIPSSYGDPDNNKRLVELNTTISSRYARLRGAVALFGATVNKSSTATEDLIGVVKQLDAEARGYEIGVDEADPESESSTVTFISTDAADAVRGIDTTLVLPKEVESQ